MNADADPDQIWRLWRRGLDTDAMARQLGLPESVVYHALQKAREARRRPVVEDRTVTAPERESPLEDD
jgi:hypothetical protein